MQGYVQDCFTLKRKLLNIHILIRLDVRVNFEKLICQVLEHYWGMDQSLKGATPIRNKFTKISSACSPFWKEPSRRSHQIEN